MELKAETYTLKLDVFSRNTGILESDIMLEKGAILIGCGSVGSLVALELAKSGVGRFFLIDSDLLGYHNICRHQCGMYDVGRYKTEALRDRILQINPYAEVITRNMAVQDVPFEELFAFSEKDSIFIGGADNREGDLYANNIAVKPTPRSSQLDAGIGSSQARYSIVFPEGCRPTVILSWFPAPCPDVSPRTEGFTQRKKIWKKSASNRGYPLTYRS